METALIKSNGYNVHIGKAVFGSITQFLNEKKYSSHYIVCDENTMNACLPDLVSFCPGLRDAAIIELEVGEGSKSLEFSAHIWQTLFENKADKKSLIINLGGGVVSDLGSFTASVYKRGIDFINVPTSLLAMADASVGGKTGINFDGIKNALGTYSQPKAVFVHPGFLRTLPARQFKNGLAEIYKIALVSDKKLWEELRSPIDESNTEYIVVKSVKLKNKIVLKDPFENGLRKILNFGHSIGHAIESLMIEELLHGEAVVIGMIMESHIAFQKKILSKTQLSEIVEVLTSTFHPQKISGLSVESISEVIKNDKKSTRGKFMFALIDAPGNCRFDVEVSENQVKRSFDYYNQL